jgi:hypothetical protein
VLGIVEDPSHQVTEIFHDDHRSRLGSAGGPGPVRWSAEI